MQVKSRKPRSEEKIPELEEFLTLTGTTSQSEKLKDRGIYYITGEIEQDSLLEVSQDVLLKHMDSKWKGDIQLIINSVGGECSEGWALVDLLDWIRMDVRTVCLGSCYSFGAILLAAGTKGKRVISPNASVMIHSASVEGLGGNLQQIRATTKDLEEEERRACEFWKVHSVYTTDEDVRKYFLDGNDHFYSVEEVLKHGIVDEVLLSNKGKSKKK